MRVANFTGLTALAYTLFNVDFDPLFAKDRRIVIDYHRCSHNMDGLVFRQRH